MDTTIHLLMQGANHKDSGIYKCLPDNAPEAQIKVHILDGGMLVMYIVKGLSVLRLSSKLEAGGRLKLAKYVKDGSKVQTFWGPPIVDKLYMSRDRFLHPKQYFK